MPPHQLKQLEMQRLFSQDKLLTKRPKKSETLPILKLGDLETRLSPKRTESWLNNLPPRLRRRDLLR